MTMKQLGLDDSSFLKQPKNTRKAQFLAEMDRVVPWPRMIALIEPHYPKPGKGRRPIALDTMLRLHFMQQWFAYSDPAMEESLHDIPLPRRFAGLDAAIEGMPDGTAHGLVHTVVGTAAKVPDVKVTDELLHGDEDEVHGDKGYTTKARNLSASDPKRGPLCCFPYRRCPGEELPEWKREINHRLPKLRARVEHPFPVIQRQFGLTKVRYRGLAKNNAQLKTLFALSNLYLVRRQLAQVVGKICPAAGRRLPVDVKTHRARLKADCGAVQRCTEMMFRQPHFFCVT